jgi:DsbC/DsbD-like thiol-disulfide interchange protein
MIPWLLIALLAFAQDTLPQTTETRHLTMKATTSAEHVAPGKKISLLIDVAPKPNMHVYSPGQQGYIAIALTLDANPAITAAKAKYPPGEKFFMAALNETQLVYAKPFRIEQDVTIKATDEHGLTRSAETPVVIKGTVRYQACDDKICYLPVNVPVSWTIAVAAR